MTIQAIIQAVRECEAYSELLTVLEQHGETLGEQATQAIAAWGMEYLPYDMAA